MEYRLSSECLRDIKTEIKTRGAAEGFIEVFVNPVNTRGEVYIVFELWPNSRILNGDLHSLKSGLYTLRLHKIKTALKRSLHKIKTAFSHTK